jgi:hypothetical protein
MDWLQSPEGIKTVAIILVAIIAIVVLWYFKQKKEALHIIQAFVQEAEDRYKLPGYGVVKYPWVVGKVYPELPVLVKLFVTEQRLGDWIEAAVDRLQKLLAEAEARCAAKTQGIESGVNLNFHVPDDSDDE